MQNVHYHNRDIGNTIRDLAQIHWGILYLDLSEVEATAGTTFIS